MPRRLHRHYGSGHLHFITSSCYHQRPLLGTTPSATYFSEFWNKSRLRYRFVVVGYVVMPAHIHLLISEPERGTPSTVMQVVKQRFAREVLHKKRRPILEPTPVWQRRFYDFNVWSQRKRVEKLRYMHRNPVKEG